MSGLSEIIETHDYEFRAYAKRLDWADGEDAYHSIVDDFLRAKHDCTILTIALMKWHIKKRLQRMWRDLFRHARQNLQYLKGRDPAPMIALHNAKARSAAARRTHCKHGHPLDGENLRIQTLKDGTVRRNCVICTRVRGRERSARYAPKRRAKRQQLTKGVQHD